MTSVFLWMLAANAEDTEQARSRAETRLAEDPTSPERWTALAVLVDDPEPLLREALRLDPNHVDALLALARTDRTALERALAIAPDDRRVRLAAADAAGDVDAARTILAAFPGDPDAALLVARLAPDDARAALASVPTPDPRVLGHRLIRDLRVGDLADAEDALARYAAAFPEAADLPGFARWVGCLRDGTIDAGTASALLDLRRVAIADPTGADVAQVGAERCPAALSLRAALHGERGAPEDAVRDLRLATSLAPDDAALAGDLGRALLAVDRPEDARPWLEREAAARPWAPPLDLADALHRLGDDPAALAVLDDPRFADVPSVILARAELVPRRADAVALLAAAARRTRNPRIVARARDLDPDLDLSPEGPPLPPLGPDVAEEVVVTARKASDLRLEELVGRLREIGYGAPIERANGELHFRAQGVDRPWITLRPDGQLDVQRAGYVPLRDPVSIDEVLGHTVVRFTVPVISERKLAQPRGRLMDAIVDDVRAWREALCAEGFEERLLAEIPATLDRVWHDGIPIDGEEVLETPAERRAAILDWWVTRTCTPEGEQVRALVVRYLDHEVQPSAWPVTDAEIAAANARRTCSGLLVLAP